MVPMAMEIRCSSTTARDWSGDALVVGVFSGDAGQGMRDLLAERFGNALAQRLEQRRFQAKPGESASLELLNHSPSSLIVVGLGAPADFGRGSQFVDGHPCGLRPAGRFVRRKS